MGCKVSYLQEQWLGAAGSSKLAVCGIHVGIHSCQQCCTYADACNRLTEATTKACLPACVPHMSQVVL
jgi:hypothetical protein